MVDQQRGEIRIDAEDEGIDVVPQRRGAQRLRHAFVQHDDARPDTDLPAIAAAQMLQRRVGHEEQGITELLHTRVQAVGDGGCLVVAHRLAAFAQRPSPYCPPTMSPPFVTDGKTRTAFASFPRRLAAGISRYSRVSALSTLRSIAEALDASAGSGAPATDSNTRTTKPITATRIRSVVLLSSGTV